MKKVIFSLLVMLTATISLDAQVFLSGDLSFDTYRPKTKDESTTIKGDRHYSSNIGVRGGYFFSDDFVVGLGLGYNFNGVNRSEGSKTFSRTFSVSPFVQYYFLHSDNFAFGAEAGISTGFSGGHSKIDNVTYKYDKSNSISIHFSPVALFWLNDNWALTSSFGSLFFRHYWSGDEVKSVENGFGLNASLSSLKFGVLYRF